MRVACQTVDEFIECLKADPNVFQDTVRVTIARRPLNGDRRDATSFEVVFQASAVVEVDAESQYLLEVGIACGKDRSDAGGEELEGSEVAAALKEQVQAYCNERQFRLLPGLIDF